MAREVGWSTRHLAARFRALVLWDQAARVGALPLGTGNKSERLLGYFTWHADDSPPINPLGDLFKTQVWALARHLGVPDVIIEKPATADLVKGVTDEDEMGVSYSDADPILHALLRGYSPDDLVRFAFDPEAVALRAGPEGRVEGEQPRLDLLDGEAGDRAGEAFGRAGARSWLSQIVNWLNSRCVRPEPSSARLGNW